MKYDMKHTRLLFASILCALLAVAERGVAQTQFDEPTRLFLMHSSGNHLKRGSDGIGKLEAATASNPQQVTFMPDGKGYYNIKADGQDLYLTLKGQWETTFASDATASNALFAIEAVDGRLVKLRCKGNNKYLGTDSNDNGSHVFADKSGTSPLHHWYFSDDAHAQPPIDTIAYMVAPSVVRQHFDGWGVSLCWWANMCGKWDDKKIDTLIDWLVSPSGLNYSHFRYNIGGGDDPENRNCDAHHMADGKGLRAEMEGFKDYSGDVYHWERDSAQRKIMLKIREKRPDAVFEAFSNSAPYYMTYSGCVAGHTNANKDNLRPEYYEEFAHYLVDVCKHYYDVYGIEFKTLEPFNEPVTNYWSANGSQEGCHMDVASQMKFIRVLAPILEESGLNTIISASDETKVGQSVTDFNAYVEGGVLPLVQQWNTHTYSATIADRARLAQLAHNYTMPLWMSEVGAGGSGIAGNLSLAQILFDDMRYLQPEAWIDWQAMEEGNDQWCTVKGSFSRQTFSRVKNYYVRQQCSRFITHGYDIITSLCNQSLAAVNEARDTLVLVFLNEGTKVMHKVDLAAFDELPGKAYIKAYRTSGSEDLKQVYDYGIDNDQLLVTLPSQSITTLVIPVTMESSPSATLHDGGEYLIVPRHETERAITANSQGKITIENITASEAQRWTFTAKGDTYYLTNALGQCITAHRGTGSTQLTAETSASSEQEFYIEEVDFPYVKILSATDQRYAFDLVSEKTAAGTTVGLWEYNTTTTPTHRQWMLVPLSTSSDDSRISLPSLNVDSRETYSIDGRKVMDDQPLQQGIYIVGDRKVLVR